MKWIGVVLILGTTTWIGFDWSSRLMKRPKHIRQLKSALQILEAEMTFSQLPIKDAFLRISSQVPNPTKSFFNSLGESMEKETGDFYQIWVDCVNKYIQYSSLTVNEQEILNQFGRTLGQHDYYQQQKHIQLTLSHLERELEDARDNQFKYSKMAKTLGILAGLFIVLLLI